MLIQRDYKRTEEDDFKVRVQPNMDKDDGAMPIYLKEDDGTLYVAAWKVKPLYE